MQSRPAGSETSPAGTGSDTPPEAIKAIKLRHPWRIVLAVVLVLLVVLFVVDAAVNRPVYNWPEVGKYLFDTRVVEAAGYTLQLTVYSMVIAIVLGIVLAVMRLSPNPVVKSVAWVYLWLFRGTPVYVQLVFWGLVGVIYKSIDVGIPGNEPWISIVTSDLLSYFALAIIGLALNEAAYMAEIVRAGLLAVDRGQEEAATALGLGWWHTMSRVILPQAMRVIIPPTGNEVISMLKTTSLVIAVPFTLELFTRTQDIAAKTYQPVPMLIVASIWYLAITSVLMVGQYYLEKHYAKGVDQRPAPQKPTVETSAVAAVEPGELPGVIPPSNRPGGGA
ncbi:amino acid ABC transporter permease [Agromyces sp. NPDC058064]|uniref:amino acid ABC transporter permease n=1 Tax=Agromyces sp. NPDC058064 TaxID=3346322 RepID=UPI0036D8F8E8